jgi:hypothetical protein
MREFVDRRTLEAGFSTPTEYVRSLIREDRRRAERDQYGPLVMKWLAEGRLTPDEEGVLPPGLLERVRQKLEAIMIEALDSGDAGEMSRDRLNAVLDRARAKVGDPKKKSR